MNIASNSFLNIQPDLAELNSARYVVLPVPYEGTVTFWPGTAGGPQAILAASRAIEEFDEELRQDFTRTGIHTCAPISPASTPQEQVERIWQRARELYGMGKFVLALGGEHSITPPLVQAAAEAHGTISVLQIDAHADLRQSYDGTPHSHACAMRRVLEITPNLCQVGIRSFSQEEYQAFPGRVRDFITPQQLEDQPATMDRIIRMLTDKVYITIDVDGLDPSLVPGTGTPEPGGLSWRQVTTLLCRVCQERTVIGADLVELLPIQGHPVSEYVAARLAYKLIAYSAYYRRSPVLSAPIPA